MSWQVKVIKNTLVGNFAQKLVLEFKEALRQRGSLDEDDEWEPLRSVSPGCYAPEFNEDHNEWIDYLVDDGILKILRKANTTGAAVFAKLDGDGGAIIWSYTFSPGGRIDVVRKNMLDCM